MASQARCPTCPIPSCPEWANWWLLVLAWDNWSTWSINVYKHIYGISGKVSRLSCPILSYMGQLVAIGAGVGQLVHMVHQCIQVYIWHLWQGVPLVPSCPVLNGLIGGYWCWPGTIGPHSPSMYTSIYMASQARYPTCPVPSCPVPSYLSNCLRYRLDPGLVLKVFESTYQILKNGISMATSLATRCKTP